MENIIQNNGLTIALSGILVVFSGLVLIAIVIHLFNKVFTAKPAGEDTQSEKRNTLTIRRSIGRPVPADHLAAIAIALELYHKLYYEKLESKITFIQGDKQSVWKTGRRFGQRVG